jgi:hypothetical protein
MTDLQQGSLFDSAGEALSSFDVALQAVPQAAKYSSYQGAYEEIRKTVSEDFFHSFPSLTTGEKVAGGVTVASGIAIALIFEMK